MNNWTEQKLRDRISGTVSTAEQRMKAVRSHERNVSVPLAKVFEAALLLPVFDKACELMLKTK
jgi:hypothetical protein